MSMSRNFLFHLLRDNHIRLPNHYGCKVKPQLYLIKLPLFEVVPDIYYQDQAHKFQQAHLSIFSVYDKKEEISEFSVSHVTSVFKTPSAKSQIKVRVYIDMGGKPQAVGEKYCSVKFIPERSPAGAVVALDKSIEADLVEAALSLSKEIVDSIYNACNALIKRNQASISTILQKLNTLEEPEIRFPILQELKKECEWSEKYRPCDSTRKYNIHLKNFICNELTTIEKRKKELNKVAKPPVSLTSSSSAMPVSFSTAKTQAAIEPKRRKGNKVLQKLKAEPQGLKEARERMEATHGFNTVYTFFKIISKQLETESLNLNDVEQVFKIANEVNQCRHQLETILGKAFYQYEIGEEVPDEIKQFLELPLSDLKQLIEGIDNLIISQEILVGLVKMRKLEMFCDLLPHFHHLCLPATVVMHDNNLLLEAAKIDEDNLSCEFAQILLSRRAKADIYDRFSNSPLMWAVMLQNEKLINLLLKYRADPNSTRKVLPAQNGISRFFYRKDKGYENKQAIYDLQTPLLVACLHRDESAIMALLKHGADPTLRSADGFDALGYYCYYMENIAEDRLYFSIKQQYQFYAHISSKIPTQRPAAKEDTVKILIAHGCEVDAYQGAGEARATPLSLAMQNQGVHEVELLKKLNADPKLVDESIFSTYQSRGKAVESQPASPKFFSTPVQNSTNAKPEEKRLCPSIALDTN